MDADGRIIFIWKPPAVVTLLHQSRQSLTCEVSLPSTPKLVVTSVYASNLAAERVDLWAELISIQQLYSLDTLPWLVAGDFNQITHPREHSSPSVQTSTSAMIQFRDSLFQMGLLDMQFQGSYNTWTNKCPTSPITKKLDRALVNHDWIISLPHSSAAFLPYEFSDYSPCLIDLATPLPIAGSKPFKFYNYLIKHPSFLQTVTEAWIIAGNFSTCLSDLCWKLKSLKSVLLKINSENYSQIQERISLVNSLLKDVQVRALQQPSMELFEEEKLLHERWCFLRTIEEAYFKQRSRINWLKEGDLNTAYFHRVALVRIAFNSIRSFLLPSGVIITDPDAMASLAVTHFQGILGPSVLPFVNTPLLWFQELIPYRCSEALTLTLSELPTSSTISQTVLKLNPNKSPGPDGFTSGFYKAMWSVLGAVS
ncbi:uncharacterized protein LOC130500242 [Raphanus sativus]|uniref:Uncharacterized protein LOC130500242 n=1 Tax=Raphanus sativus TaxID=3726 RepID=A0A9W3CHB8_RAPSA|nr:uncharacterized protein LOC130500242 [Raphanus sativus]